MKLRSSEKNFVDLEKLELDRHKHLEEALKGNEYDGRGNLSVSMPLSEINDFKYAVLIRFQGKKPWRTVVRDFCNKFTEETDAVALDNAEKSYEFDGELVKVLRERVQKEGDLVQSVIDKFVNEGVSGIETVLTKGRYSKPIENVSPVGFRDVLQIWDKIPIELRDPARPDDVRRCMKSLEDRLAKVKNRAVRLSAQDQLEKLKHRELAEVFGEGDGTEEPVEKKSIEELMQAERAKRGQDNGAAVER